MGTLGQWIAILILMAGFWVGVLLITRAIWLWYWRIRDIIALQSEQLEQLKLLNHQVGQFYISATGGRVVSNSTAYPQGRVQP